MKPSDLTPAMLRLMSPADRATYDPLKLSEPVVVDDGRQTGLEKDLQRVCELELSRRGIWYLHLSPRARERAGCPDLLFATAPGVAWAIELKTATGTLSKAQRATLDLMEQNGWQTAVVRSYSEFRKLVFGQ